MSSRAGELGNRNTELNITSNLKIVEAFGSYRELVVRHRRDYYAREISKLRFALAETTGDLYFMPYVSKYIIEITVILGALLIGAVQFILQDATHAISTLAIFLAAGTRIAPAILRVQQGVIQIRSSIGQATPTLELVNALGNEVLNENSSNLVDIFHEGFISEISISNITFTYPSKTAPTLDGVNFEITPGTSVAIVGPSGAGKTSLIDIMLGVLNPDKGEVLISGLPPSAAIAKWPGAIAYVPQDVMIAAGTIRENVGLGYPMEEITDELLKSALKISHLEDFVSKLPGGADAQVGERGALISGGQRQRLGIARAMFTRPHILVLDEATSSLDSETESSISDAIQGLRGSTTVVMIAHRLSTIKDADQVIYLAEGKVIAHGSFDYVREAVPDFDRQAKLMGL
jgi:ABC-type multidrug transport system fused ATPase/permease subunit